MAKTYDPASVIVVFNGYPLSGFQDGSMVKIAYNRETWQTYVGSAGEVARSKTNDYSAKISVTLAQTALDNEVLSGFYNADKFGNAGQGVLEVIDTSSPSNKTIYSAVTAWIEKIPDSDFGREVQGREWVFQTGNLNAFLAGNEE